MPRWSRVLVHSTILAISITAFIQVQKEVPKPYLVKDEIFHIPQAQRYCQRDWGHWDPSITTPPGLYILAVIPLKLLRLACTPSLLRLTNFLLNVIALPTIITSIQSPNRRPWAHHVLHPTLSARIISFFPLIFFFSLLVYTDVGSLTFVLGSYALARRDQHVAAALVSATRGVVKLIEKTGAASLWFRQTNIVWAAFVLATSILGHWTSVPGGTTLSADPSLADVHSWRDIQHAFQSLLKAANQHRLSSLSLIAPYLPVFAAFAAFLKWNGGIVLGHKEMHVAVVHIPQLLYFVAFASGLLAPVLVSGGGGVVRLVRGTFAMAFGSWKRVLVFTLLLACTDLAVHKYTVEHPFLLADNRHYTFYVWQRVFRRYSFARYALTPGYVLSSYAWLHALGKRTTLFWTVGFVFCTSLVLIPTPLIEPRYFLIPLILLRLQFSPARGYLALEGALYLGINAVTVYMFLYRPFEWPGWEEGSMRFMW